MKNKRYQTREGGLRHFTRHKRIQTKWTVLSLFLASLMASPGLDADELLPSPLPPIAPRVTVVDIDIDHTASVTLSDGKAVEVTVVRVEEKRDPIRRVLRRARVHLLIDGQPVVLTAGLYNRPVQAAGIQIDCPVTQGYMLRSGADYWGLEKDVRLRFWPGNEPLTAPDTFCYPIKQQWLASLTWFDNEPVDGGAEISETVYYHAGIDLGALEGDTVVLAAADALVVSARNETLPEFEEDTPVRPRDDVVYLYDGRGWFYRYSHFHHIAEDIEPGKVLSLGTVLGTVGKEGASGGWSHLHFAIKCRQPSGQWGAFAAYALLREAYMRENDPQIIANARQRHLLLPGDSALLDGSASWSASGAPLDYVWHFTDGETAAGKLVQRVYNHPGSYTETLHVTDAAGRVDYDFAIVQVIDPENPSRYSPSLHAVYEPTFNIRPGTPITFAVRAFRFDGGEEVWDFGDGSPHQQTKSSENTHPHAPQGYARIEHRYDAPGDYIVRVHRINDQGIPAFTRLHVNVGAPKSPAALLSGQ